MGGILKGKVIDIKEWRARKKNYPLDDFPEWVVSNDDIEKLTKQGRWIGTYTPPPPYGLGGRNDGDR
jgi:hypothetical protein